MATITGADYNQAKYLTPIASPKDSELQGDVVITLTEPPIGQPNFVKGQAVIVVRTYNNGTQTMHATISDEPIVKPPNTVAIINSVLIFAGVFRLIDVWKYR
ncbi:MAG: hypothetical protein HYZ43_00155, partial [Flavobacteriia bacterium]|nr:hypothetical protein [Flavobacteriia bacterium]